MNTHTGIYMNVYTRAFSIGKNQDSKGSLAADPRGYP